MKKYKAIISVFIILSIILFNSGNVYAFPEKNEEVLLEQVFEAKVKAEDENISISTIKKVMDFANNKYTIIECEPLGYFIFHDESGIFVEYSSSSPSPFLGYWDDLYYGGATEYYVYDGGKYTHTLLDESYSSDSEALLELVGKSNANNELYMQSPDKDVINYLANGDERDLLHIIVRYTSLSQTASYNLISGYQMFQFMSSAEQMGFFDSTYTNLAYVSANPNGYCGFIASAMMLLWFDTYVNSSVIDTINAGTVCFKGGKSWNPSTNNWEYNGEAFPYNFWVYHGYVPYGYATGVWAYQIYMTVHHYLNTKNITVNDFWTALPTTSSIKTHIDTEDTPYVLFGNLGIAPSGTKTNHAVTVYGYNENYLIANYGIPPSGNVAVYGTWGSVYAITSMS